MKILFVDLLPRSRLFRSPLWMPTCFTPAAGLLRKEGHEVSFLERGRMEMEACGRWEEVEQFFRREMLRRRPDVVVFDVRGRVLSDFIDLGRQARRATPTVLILAGGRHPTLLPECCLDAGDFLDGVLVGEPEVPLRALAAGTPLGELPSAAVRCGGSVAPVERGEPLMDLDALPFPAWDLLDMKYYSARTPRTMPCLMLRTATVNASRGCAGTCTFCNEGRFFSRPVRYHSGRYVAGMVSQLVSDYGVEGIYFADEMFLASRERAAEICEELIRTGITRKVRWSAQVRTDSVEPEILALMKKAGCVQLEFGVESGSQRVLDALKKGITVGGSMAALQAARRAGIRTLAYVMYGIPDERVDDIRMTREFLRRTRPDIVRLLRAIPIPGTAMAETLIEKGRLEEKFWEGQVRRGNPYGGNPPNLTSMTDDELRREGRRLYRATALRAYGRDFLRRGGLLHLGEVFYPGELIGFALRSAREYLFP